MGIISRGFGGRRRESVPGLPPGQYLTHAFPLVRAVQVPDRVFLDLRGAVRLELPVSSS